MRLRDLLNLAPRSALALRARAPASQRRPPRRKMQVISVVDDDPSVRAATVDLLDSAGLACLAFASAEAFLSSGAGARTSCLILHVSLPKPSGIQLHPKPVQARPSIPTIFL